MQGETGPGVVREIAIPYKASVLSKFRAGVLKWATPEHLRDFPWRHTRDPFRLLLSELMLRRTQARQVVPVFVEFFERWPDLFSFLDAGRGELATVLQPLGLQWRIQNVVEVQDALRNLGNIPKQYRDLLLLPGVGDYVASAVLCFSQQEVRPLIDTNTVRIIGRYFGQRIHQGTRRLKAFRQLSENLVPPDNAQASAYHYGLLDLAAAICRPARPLCHQCPLSPDCMAVRLEGPSSTFPEPES